MPSSIGRNWKEKSNIFHDLILALHWKNKHFSKKEKKTANTGIFLDLKGGRDPLNGTSGTPVSTRMRYRKSLF